MAATGSAATESRRAVLLCADARYVAPLAVVLRSLARSQHVGSSVEVVVGSVGIPTSERPKLRAAAHPLPVDFVEVGDALPADIPLANHYPRTVYGRFWLLDRLPPQVQRAVYLDADVIVRADLAPLFDAPLSRHGVAAVPDVGVPHVAHPFGLPNWRDLDLDPTTPYFNSGVLVVDPARWRSGRMTEQILRYVTTHRHQLRMPDQDGFNAVVRGEITRLPLRWNQLHRLREPTHLGYSLFPADEVDAAITDPAVVHLSTLRKPWMEGCDDPAAPWWWDLLAETAYRGRRLDRAPLRERALRVGGRVARRIVRA